jgi:hypothetical protein
MFHGLVPDSPVLYAGVKVTKKARRQARKKDVEFFTPEFKSRFSKLVDDFDKWSKVKYEEAKQKRDAR